MKKIIFLLSIFFISLNFVSAKEKVLFSSCIDGDTIKVSINNEKYTVRFLAIDTPEYSSTEIDYYGKEASEYTCNRVKNAKTIELEYDKNSDKEDKYGRILAWVFVDGTLIEEELVEKGYAKVAYLYADYKYTNILKEKQELASAKNLGIWNREEEKAFDPSQEQIEKEETNIIENIEVIVIGIVILLMTIIGKSTITKEKCKKNKKN